MYVDQSELMINSGSFLYDFKFNVASLIFSVVIRSTSLSELESRELFTRDIFLPSLFCHQWNCISARKH